MKSREPGGPGANRDVGGAASTGRTESDSVETSVTSDEAATRADWPAIVHKVREGDPIALARLTALITGLLARQGAYQVQNAWDDICQEVLEILVRSVEERTLREPRAFVRFAQTVTRNRCLDQIFRRERITSGGRRDESQVRESFDRKDILMAVDSDPDVLLDLERALLKLSRRTRSVVQEIYLRGHTYQETSDRLGIPLGTVKRLQTQGLKALRAELEIRSY